jgi:hypothetical protein
MIAAAVEPTRCAASYAPVKPRKRRVDEIHTSNLPALPRCMVAVA